MPSRSAARLDRSVIAAAVAGAAVLAGVATAWGAHNGAKAAAGFAVGAGAVWAFLVAALWRRRGLNQRDGEHNPDGDGDAGAPRPTLTVATWITVGRGLLISVVGGFVLAPRPSSSAAASVPGALYLLAVVGDVLDGALARRTGTTTGLGAALDVTTDATGLLVAPLLGVVWGRLPPWYLLLSAAYPLFKVGLAARRRRGRPVFPERVRPNRWARRFAATQMGVVAAALFPVLPAAVTWTAATVAMLPTLVLFAGEWRIATGAAPVARSANKAGVASVADAQAPAQRPEP